MTAVLSGPVIFIKFFSVYYKILLITELSSLGVLGHFPAPRQPLRIQSLEMQGAIVG